jgi:hypothetical protein
MENLHLIIFLIIILGIVIINCLSHDSYENFDNANIEYEAPTNDIKESDVGHRGVFANRDYEEGETLEVCPCIKQEHESVAGRVADYLFSLNEEESLIAFGYCSMYNHSDDPNANWHIINEDQMMIEATRKIKKGEEIFISYGDSYWESRNSIKN